MNTVQAIKLPIVIRIHIITAGGYAAKEYIFICMYIQVFFPPQKP
jgi:hypothetical protein